MMKNMLIQQTFDTWTWLKKTVQLVRKGSVRVMNFRILIRHYV